MKYFRIEWSKTFIFATTFMKQRWLHIVLLFLLLVLGGTQQTHAASAQDDDKELALQWLTFTRSQQKDQATLSDASEFVRICGSRSERVVPAQTVVIGENSTRNHLLFTFKNVFEKHYCGLQASPTSAIMLLSPADYYIVCLRRLLI
ncbi:hypothetical protein [Prevotella disiens]|nr:hypothetical protein [Prevotella disiens]